MSSAKQNHIIARLIVGAMSIDGVLDTSEREKVAATLEQIGMAELIADVGAVLESDFADFNMFTECKNLATLLGASASDVAPLVFRVVADVVASDRFVSSREAAYLSALAKRLEIDTGIAQSILKQVMAERRGRLEIAGSNVDQTINPHLKELLSFQGAEKLVGQVPEDEFEQLLSGTKEALAEGERVSLDEIGRALTILGLERTDTFAQAEEVWRETINTLDLPKMAALGETFVSAAINRITRVNDAYKVLLRAQRRATPKA